MTLWMTKSNQNRQDNIKHRTHSITEHIKGGHAKPMCPSFMLSCPVGLRFTIPCVICFSLSCPLVMCSCIICVLSYFIFLVHSDCFFHSMCHIISCPLRKCFLFILCVLCFILSCPLGLFSSIGCVICFVLSCPGMCFCLSYVSYVLRIAFPHPMCHTYYHFHL